MKIFVSHSWKDRENLHKLKEQMSDYGAYCFLAHEDIEPGEHDLKRIKQEILKCDIFLFVGNEYSKQSEYCNQEIGMAIAHKKTIISTVHADMSPWGFIQRQQAIKYRDILRDVPSPLRKQIVKSPEYKKYWESKLESLNVLGIKGFSVDEKKTNYIKFKSDNFNDYGYYTTFHILIENERIGSIKIGYKNQNLNTPKTKDELPRCFRFLTNDYFSRIKLEENSLLESKKQALYCLLNDMRHNKKIAKKYINKEVVTDSLFRDEIEELKELKRALNN